MLAAEEQTLLIVGLAYLAVVGILAWRIAKRSNQLLRTVRDNVESSLWQRLGAPESMTVAM